MGLCLNISIYLFRMSLKLGAKSKCDQFYTRNQNLPTVLTSQLTLQMITHLSDISEPDLRVLLAIDVGLVVDHTHQIPEVQSLIILLKSKLSAKCAISLLVTCPFGAKLSMLGVRCPVDKPIQ